MPAGIPGSRPSVFGRSPRPASIPLPCTAPPGIRAATAPFSAAGIRCIVSFRIRGSFSVPHHHGRLVPVVRVQHFAQPRLPALPRGLRDCFHAYRFAHTFLLSPAPFRAQAAVPFRRPARFRGNKKGGDVPGVLHPEEGRLLWRISPLRCHRPFSLRTTGSSQSASPRQKPVCRSCCSASISRRQQTSGRHIQSAHAPPAQGQRLPLSVSSELPA